MRNRRIRIIITIFAVVFTSAIVCGCGFEKLPPKTNDAAKEYIKPKGVVPTKEEKEIVKAAKAEYEQATAGQN
ncbi:MAG: hypothetical protein ACI3ZO_05345 [Candidatus Cryptobacteroides sp.]|nr:hypothetical protein [Bacteroidales bacterium]